MFDEPHEHRTERESLVDAGAFIMGRNMFGPRGEQYDKTWRGWWGDEPPYHAPVFVLTHTPREPVVMQGGTTFHFVADGIGRHCGEPGPPPATGTWPSWAAPTSVPVPGLSG
jgi:dihydrofolate reductase